MARARKASKKKTVSVNFTGVESRVLLPEDDYHVKVSEVTKEEGSKGDYLKWVFEVTEGKFEGNKVYFNTSLTEQSLWNLKNLLTTLGVEVPNDELDIDLDELVDLEMMAAIAHENYEGKRQARLVDFYASDESAPAPADEDEDEEEEEKPAKKSSKKSSKKDEDEEDEEDEEEEEEEAPPAKKKRGRPAKAKAEDEDEDEDEKPAKKAKGKKAKKLEPMDASEVQDLDEEELEEVIEKYGLDVEIDELKTLRKKVSAVMDALEEAGMLAE
jgi:flagellar biosynthesis GTPase FlhF